MQLSQEAPISVRMGSTESEEQSKRLAHNNKTTSLSFYAEEGKEMILDITAERYDILLPWNDYKVCNEYLE